VKPPPTPEELNVLNRRRWGWRAKQLHKLVTKSSKAPLKEADPAELDTPINKLRTRPRLRKELATAEALRRANEAKIRRLLAQIGNRMDDKAVALMRQVSRLLKESDLPARMRLAQQRNRKQVRNAAQGRRAIGAATRERVAKMLRTEAPQPSVRATSRAIAGKVHLTDERVRKIIASRRRK
jgi:hypothetical protein